LKKAFHLIQWWCIFESRAQETGSSRERIYIIQNTKIFKEDLSL